MTVDKWIREFVVEWKKRIGECELEVSNRISSRTDYKILINEGTSSLYIEHLEFINRNRFRLFILVGDLPMHLITGYDYEEFEGYPMDFIFSEITRVIENMVRQEIIEYQKEFFFDECMYSWSHI